MFMNIAMKFNNLFYKYVAVGIGILYGFQVFLTIGGVTKFIPLTGVTLPLISYGGTTGMVRGMPSPIPIPKNPPVPIANND